MWHDKGAEWAVCCDARGTEVATDSLTERTLDPLCTDDCPDTARIASALVVEMIDATLARCLLAGAYV